MIKNMVDRFLCWKLPRDFAPDCGISFEEGAWWPTGTNLLHAGQAKEMIEHLLSSDSGMSFGLAIEALKLGKKVARAGWNGKGMWLSLSGPIEGRRIGNEAFWSLNNAQYAAEQPDCCATVLPCITMKTATGEILMGWLASQTDMLADDWLIVE